jgi:hypothetical protein
MLPDDVLLGIFDFYVNEDTDVEEWITLAHVCKRWRTVVFLSPRRLNLRLRCGPETPVRDTLDIWPPLPLSVHDAIFDYKLEQPDLDNIVAALEHNDRVCQIQFYRFSSSQLEYHVANSAFMQKPFPELTDLLLSVDKYDGEQGPILPDSFLDGTAPRLRSLILANIPFPGLPKLLLSTTHLVNLELHDIPISGYIPPEEMATSLSALTILESLWLDIRCPAPESRPPSPLTHFILPSLTKLIFRGPSEYLEEFLTRTDAPQLNDLHITFFNEIIFGTPRLFQFISQRPTLRVLEKGQIAFNFNAIKVKFPSQTFDYGVLSVAIPCFMPEAQLSFLKQICTSSLPPVSTLVDLSIFEDKYSELLWQDDDENILLLWLELLHPFAAVKNLYVCKKFVPRIAPVLQELVGGRTTDVLPALENLFLEGFQPSGPLHQGIEKFVAARRLTGHPVAVSRWDRDLEQEVHSAIYDP